MKILIIILLVFLYFLLINELFKDRENIIREEERGKCEERFNARINSMLLFKDIMVLKRMEQKRNERRD